jgi:hypothetical protein
LPRSARVLPESPNDSCKSSSVLPKARNTLPKAPRLLPASPRHVATESTVPETAPPMNADGRDHGVSLVRDCSKDEFRNRAVRPSRGSPGVPANQRRADCRPPSR